MNESHPGLWEFPMWDIQDDKGVVLTNMDPQVGAAAPQHCGGLSSPPVTLRLAPTHIPLAPLQGDIYEAYKREFDRSYYG